MSCGCGGKGASSPPERARDHAAMCEVCPHARRGPSLTLRSSAVWCDAAPGRGQPVMVRVTIEDCPVGTFDRGPLVRWLGVMWYGVPMPVRLWLRLTHPKRPRVGSFGGCGCIKRLKDLTTTLQARRTPPGLTPQAPSLTPSPPQA